MQCAVVAVQDSSQVAEARRVAAQLARDHALTETTAGKIAIAVTEAATNLIRHAGGGEIVLHPLPPSAHLGGRGLDVFALDKGPGMADPGACLRDGYSSVGTAGEGLGAIRRLADEFDLYSQFGKGTVIFARICDPPTPYAVPRFSLDVGAIRVPMPGEEVCGDDWGIRIGIDTATVVVADGLGHGPQAAEASRAAVAVLGGDSLLSPTQALERIYDSLRPTRGAAVAVACLFPVERQVRFAGLGNISGYLLAERSQHLVSMNGTAGHTPRRIQEFTYSWPAGAPLVLHSDGLSTSWNLAHYPGLLAHHPAVIAAVLYRDAARGRDDASVIVVREKAA